MHSPAKTSAQRCLIAGNKANKCFTRGRFCEAPTPQKLHFDLTAVLLPEYQMAQRFSEKPSPVCTGGDNRRKGIGCAEEEQMQEEPEQAVTETVLIVEDDVESNVSLTRASSKTEGRACVIADVWLDRPQKVLLPVVVA